MLRPLLIVLTLFLSSVSVFAQMTSEQREHEFKNLVSLYSRTYAPRSWKIQSIGVDIADIRPWLNRVHNAKTDVEFFEICSEYVASFQDGHARYLINSSFYADMGIWFDIYDGKVLVEGLDRQRYPVNQFPLAVGDELISIDGVSTEDILKDLSKYRGFGNPRATVRLAADAISYRSQQIYANAVNLPDNTQVVIRNQAGESGAYTFTWKKAGIPFRNVSPTTWPSFNGQGLLNSRTSPVSPLSKGEDDPRNSLYDLQWSSISPLEKEGLERTLVTETGDTVTRAALTGWGSAFPYYILPENTQLRISFSGFLTGVYQAEGKRIGYLRIGHFSPSDPVLAVKVLESEIQYFEQNTDGLVIDDTRNTGGYGCLALDYAQRLIPYAFNFPRVHYRPSQSMINSMYSSLYSAQQYGEDEWIINTYQFYLDNLIETAKSPNSVTGAVPFCVPFTGRSWAPTVENYPATDIDGKNLAYTKPLIVLVDELSASTGDIFPAVIQDAKRGLVVGMRTAGLGGAVASTRTGMFSEGVGYFTQSLLVRDTEAEAPGIPPSKFIENVGVVPDIELDYMKRENLMSRGQPFVERVTSIIVEEIRKSNSGQ